MKKKANNTGSVTLDKSSGKYLARFTSPVTGKRIAKRFATKKEAEAWIAQQLTEATQGTFVEPSKLTLGDWCCEYLETYSKPHVAPRTLQSYIDLAGHLEPLWPVPLQKLNAIQAQKFINGLTIGDNTKMKVCRFLKQLYKKAHALGLVAKDITIAIDTPKYKPKEIETFTLDEIQHILETVKGSYYYNKYYTLIHLAAASGMRLGEVLGLKISNVFPDHIHVDNNVQDLRGKSRQDQKPKTDAGIRDIALAPNIIAELKQTYLSPVVKTEYVFHTKDGHPYIHVNMERMWKHVLIEAGIPHKHFHALRHTHATELLGRGIPLLEVSHRLGHSKPSHTLDLYGHAIKDYDSKIAQLVASMF